MKDILNSLYVSVEYFVIGAAASIFPLLFLWLPARYNSLTITSFEIDMLQNETKFQIAASAKDFLGYMFWMMPIYYSGGVFISILCRYSVKKIGILFLMTSLFLLPFLILHVFLGMANAFVNTLPMLGYLSLPLTLRFIFGVEKIILSAAVKYSLLLFLAFVISQISSTLNRNAVSFPDWVSILLIIPALREISLIISRFAVSDLLRMKNDNNKYFKPATTMFLLWCQSTWSIIIRLTIITIQNRLLQIFVTVAVGIQEIVLRLTLSCRLDYGNKVVSRISPKPTQKKLASKEKVHRTNLMKVMVVGEMVSEYLAIFITPPLLWIFFEVRLGFPFSYYDLIPNVLQMTREDLVISSLVFPFITQLIVEFFVDTLCCSIESKTLGSMRLSLGSGEESAFTFWLITGISALPAHAITYIYIVTSNQMLACRSQNACCCYQNGLKAGGLYEQYCLQAIPNLDNFLSQNCTFSET